MKKFAIPLFALLAAVIALSVLYWPREVLEGRWLAPIPLEDVILEDGKATKSSDQSLRIGVFSMCIHDPDSCKGRPSISFSSTRKGDLISVEAGYLHGKAGKNKITLKEVNDCLLVDVKNPASSMVSLAPECPPPDFDWNEDKTYRWEADLRLPTEAELLEIAKASGLQPVENATTMTMERGHLIVEGPGLNRRLAFIEGRRVDALGLRPGESVTLRSFWDLRDIGRSRDTGIMRLSPEWIEDEVNDRRFLPFRALPLEKRPNGEVIALIIKHAGARWWWDPALATLKLESGIDAGALRVCEWQMAVSSIDPRERLSQSVVARVVRFGEIAGEIPRLDEENANRAALEALRRCPSS